MKAMIVGGSNGIGLSIAMQLSVQNSVDQIFIVDKNKPSLHINDKIQYYNFDLCRSDFSFFDDFEDIDILIYTAGLGRVTPFENLNETEIRKNFEVNAIAPTVIINKFYPLMKKREIFCAVLSSISSKIVSPLFSVYGSTKASLSSLIENLNIELIKNNSNSRILDVSPGLIEGTSFYGGITDVDKNSDLAIEIINRMFNKDLLFIPNEEVYNGVIKRYNDDKIKFGLESYDYKINRINNNSPIVVGYLSGCFDMFHIGHLNLITRAKKYCDYLIVGVHKNGSHKNKELIIPYEQRCAIISNLKDVDLVVEACAEDSDAYNIYKFDYLFVGSDYKNTERFLRYEELFKETNTKIIYFPYTEGVSSTILRKIVKNKVK